MLAHTAISTVSGFFVVLAHIRLVVEAACDAHVRRCLARAEAAAIRQDTEEAEEKRKKDTE